MRGESGAVLLEVMLALVLLAVGGTAAVVMASESARAVQHAREVDTEMRAASAFFDAVALWPREDLDRHLGERAQGSWRMTVQRPTPTLYTVVLRDTLRGAEILRTSLFRPEPVRGEI
jgi:type II secretory pathway pseudopilin PulG